ncbi:MAG TPA: class I SAM-dependent methyltransferase [Thermoanaerobaculia bacterium]|jgi:methyltransferase (TIGR00027 family)
MREGVGSRTAERVAARRAAHQLLDAPLVFSDPLALRILAPEVADRIREDPKYLDRSPVSKYLRAFLVVRSRIAEEEVAAAVARGVRQYAIVGAGYDTFAYRNPFPDLRVFEVDHPSTQREKRRRLEEAGIPVPSNVTFVAADLSLASLDDALASCTFDHASPAVVSWLGVVPYLEMDAIEATLASVGRLPAGTTIVFDYGLSGQALNMAERFVVRRMAKRVAEAGEPWKTFFLPDEMAALLRRTGFSSHVDWSGEEINARYFAGREDGLRVGRAGRIVKAVV